MANIEKRFNIMWIDEHRRPTVKPNPAYPNGQDLDCSAGAEQKCTLKLPLYPTPGCGKYLVTCRLCGTNAMITTAGRVDDARSLTLPCELGNGRTVRAAGAA